MIKLMSAPEGMLYVWLHAAANLEGLYRSRLCKELHLCGFTSTLTRSSKMNQHNAATARARASARLMGTRLQRQSQPISTCGESGGRPKALSSSGLSWILRVCKHRGRQQFLRSRRAKPLWASWMLRVCGHRGRHRFLHSRRAKPLSMHRFLMAGV
jgi:hypothetical protein